MPQVVDTTSRSTWKQVESGARSLVLASTPTAIVDLVEYARSNPIIDPYKDNFRYVIEGAGDCTEQLTQIPVRTGDLIVVPMGVQRSCTAATGELTFLTLSVARTRGDTPPAGGRINLGRAFRLVRNATAPFAYASVYRSRCCRILASRISRLEGHPSGDDQFIYVIGGAATLSLQGTRHELRAGSLAVIPTNAEFALRASAAPIEALWIRVSQADLSS